MTIESGPQFQAGDHVRSERFGLGSVELDKGQLVLVRFDHGIEMCEKATLKQELTLSQAIVSTRWDAPLEVLTRVQAEAVRSINDAWGVFSPSRIALLPHQMWVCKRVQEQWPTRWLVADDVGLGKTVEAGLILWPYLARKQVKRFLILCPASLVNQWAERLWRMFDIRVDPYSSEDDTPRSDYWAKHNQVVASIQTLRMDGNGRQQRLFDAEPWDLVLVDEAHHLNADEQMGPTLGYELVEGLVSRQLVESMVFFTGTPHRGKNHGFLSLLRLLRPDLFDPKESMESQLRHLNKVMIRNNKQNVTDLEGKRLFFQPKVSDEMYSYSPAEAHFYQMMTEFIESGRAYASQLGEANGRAVILVLIAMQKLASSSVAAIRRAIQGRLERTQETRKNLDEVKARRAEFKELRDYEELESSASGDELAQLDEDMARLTAKLQLMENEHERLLELVEAANAVGTETKILRILDLVEGPFKDRQVLFFTEYKATQSLLMSALAKRYGIESVTFINGDGRADDVTLPDGSKTSLSLPREAAAEKFNAGGARFLVSTEAAGEGIDLQERCYTLVHVDLPWNPMRLHQRVGRVNRYGQKERVEVVILRNPETVESRIWDKLNEKLDAINLTLQHGMEQPEDMMELVLGMTSPSMFREVYSEAQHVPAGSFAAWFDQKTARFGGQDVINVVQDLIGRCEKFDYQSASSQIPKVDLPDLEPFFKNALVLGGRKVKDDAAGLSFMIPDSWKGQPGLKPRYDRMVFDRGLKGKDAGQRVLGVGHKAVDRALAEASKISANLAPIPQDLMPHPIYIFKIRDELTGGRGGAQAVLAGVEVNREGAGGLRVLRDWQLLGTLNELSSGRGIRRGKSNVAAERAEVILELATQAKSHLSAHLPELDLPFKVPAVEPIATLWPVPRALSPSGDTSEPEEDD